MKSVRRTLTCAALAAVCGATAPAGAAAAPAPSPAPAPAKTFTVVIDPGHGGEDTGATFRAGVDVISEKHLTLLLAKEVAAQLHARAFQAVLTRTDDVAVPLADRTALANRIEAQVFISLHMNSATHRGVRIAGGVETYILNNSTDESSRRLADLENSVLEGSVAALPSEKSDVSLILKDLILDSNLAESKRLACLVQERLVAAAANDRLDDGRNRGVKQALFYVLLGSDMPSALVETGFIDNARDRSLVLSGAGRSLLGRSIADALDSFRRASGTPDAQRTLARCKVN